VIAQGEIEELLDKDVIHVSDKPKLIHKGMSRQIFKERFTRDISHSILPAIGNRMDAARFTQKSFFRDVYHWVCNPDISGGRQELIIEDHDVKNQLEGEVITPQK